MKKILQEYIEGVRTQGIKEENFNNVLVSINDSNMVFGLIDEKYAKAVDTMLRSIVSTYQYDWLMWWIYEAEYGGGSCIGVSDSSGAGDLSTFDQFYAFVFESKPLAEILNV
jgi:hypothetical protein